jgi:hypothetical protein
MRNGSLPSPGSTCLGISLVTAVTVFYFLGRQAQDRLEQSLEIEIVTFIAKTS